MVIPTRMEQKLEELNVYLDSKFEVKKQSISEITKETCNSMFKSFVMESRKGVEVFKCKYATES